MRSTNKEEIGYLKVIELKSQLSDFGVTISIYLMFEIKRNLHFPKHTEDFHFQLLSDFGVLAKSSELWYYHRIEAWSPIYIIYVYE